MTSRHRGREEINDIVTTFITKKRGNVEEGEKFSSLEKEENI